MTISWGSLFLAIAMLIFLALAVDLFDVHAKSIDWNFLAHFFLCLGLLLGGMVLRTITFTSKGK